MSTFLDGEGLSKAIGDILREDSCRCAVAFWGAGASKKLAKNPAGLKLVCNLVSGGTNPFEIEKLPRSNIRQCDTLHAKVCIGRERAVISSANISANGLGLEGVEQSHWIEAGVALDEFSDVSEWFDALWQTSRPISDDDLRRAKTKWRQRQTSKPSLPSFRNFDPEQAEIPLLYWLGEADYELNRKVIKEQFGAYDEQAQKLLEEGIEVERGDRKVMKSGTWIVLWSLANNGLPKRRPGPQWFFTGRLIEKSFRYKGERNYRDSALEADNRPPVPFDLGEPRMLKAFLHTLSLDEFSALREDSENNTFYTPIRRELNRQFWRNCKDHYLNQR